jgi:hypothetical protein
VSMSISVFDIECLNAFLRRLHIIGRSSDFSTVCAKLTLKEHSLAYERVFGRPLADNARDAAKTLKTLCGSVDEAKPNKPGPKGPSGYKEFLKNECKQQDVVENFSGRDHDSTGGNSCRMEEVQRRWKQLPASEVQVWRASAPQARIPHPDQPAVVDTQTLKVRTPPAWVPKAKSLTGCSDSILREDEYEHILDSFGTTKVLEEEWKTTYNQPIGVEEAGCG